MTTQTPSDSREKAEEILLKHLNNIQPEHYDPSQKAWNFLAGKDKAEAAINAIIEYHSNELSKVKGLPTDKQIGKKFSMSPRRQDGAKWMRDEFAAPLFASEKSKYDELQSRYDELMRVAEAQKKLLQMADVPALLIENPTMIESRSLTEDDINWAKERIEKFKSKQQ